MKIINLILGIAATVILASLITLGIKAFYPVLVAPTYPNSVVVPCASGDTPCLTADQNTSIVTQNQFNSQETAYESAMQVYNRNLFIIANIIGIIVFAIGFFLIFGGAEIAARGVPIGIMLAGLYSILYGYAVGWGSVGDQLKFFIGLVIAVLILGGSMWLIQRYARKEAISDKR